MTCIWCSPVVPQGSGCRRHRARCTQCLRSGDPAAAGGSGTALSVPRAGRVGRVLPSTGIKTEVVIKTEPEDDSYGDCCPREKEEPPDPTACEWGWAHGGARGCAMGSRSLLCPSVPL